MKLAPYFAGFLTRASAFARRWAQGFATPVADCALGLCWLAVIGVFVGWAVMK